MKAVRFHEAGGPEVLRYEDAPEPEPGANDLLVKVEAASINRADLLLRQGKYPTSQPFPRIPGFEVAGTVERVGEMVKGWKPGDRVFGLATGMAYAEKATMPSQAALPVPEGLDMAEAAAIPVVFLTAWGTLHVNANLQPGEWVLIHSAGSGVGVAAIQLARYLGARVIVTAGSDEKLQRARELGAEYGINYNTQRFRAEVKKITEGRMVDVILDGIGASTFEENLMSLAPRGRLTLIGIIGGMESRINIGMLMSRNLSVHGFYLMGMLGAKELTETFRERILPLFSTGQMVSLVDKVYSLSEAAQAHQYMEDRRNFGKVVLVP